MFGISGCFLRSIRLILFYSKNKKNNKWILDKIKDKMLLEIKRFNKKQNFKFNVIKTIIVIKLSYV